MNERSFLSVVLIQRIHDWILMIHKTIVEWKQFFIVNILFDFYHNSYKIIFTWFLILVREFEFVMLAILISEHSAHILWYAVIFWCDFCRKIVILKFWIIISKMALNLQVKVHPVVLFQIVDAFERRNADSQRVIGTLLGEFINLISHALTYNFCSRCFFITYPWYY